jgi:hypothetical protein
MSVFTDKLFSKLINYWKHANLEPLYTKLYYIDFLTKSYVLCPLYQNTSVEPSINGNPLHYLYRTRPLIQWQHAH